MAPVDGSVVDSATSNDGSSGDAGVIPDATGE